MVVHPVCLVIGLAGFGDLFAGKPLVGPVTHHFSPIGHSALAKTPGVADIGGAMEILGYFIIMFVVWWSIYGYYQRYLHRLLKALDRDPVGAREILRQSLTGSSRTPQELKTLDYQENR